MARNSEKAARRKARQKRGCAEGSIASPANTPARMPRAERYGNELCGVWPYVAVLTADALMHMGLALLFGTSPYIIVRLIISFIFFIYPFYFVADVLWSMRPRVSTILAGETKINRKYYANVARTDMPSHRLPSVTVSVAVYKEENPVIFETIRQGARAAAYYQEQSGKTANVVVSDDGLAPLLGGFCSEERVQQLLACHANAPQVLSKEERSAAERILFYREAGVGFVARPAKNRAGSFKTASNLNYTLKLGERYASCGVGFAFGELFKTRGEFEQGYAEGDIVTHEIILLLDKDSGVPEHIIEAVAPEFVADTDLAYAQCATNAQNYSENYYTRAFGYQINNLSHNIWPSKALQGYFVPLVGHNVFLRKQHLFESGLWSEDKVSEDYDKAISFYNHGFHGKYMQIAGLDFTEYVSRTFAEEAGKQLRYCYGLIEMIFQGTIVRGKTRACDQFYMVLYFCSLINAVMLFPTALFESYFGDIYLLWAGFAFCMLCYILLPCLRSFVMRRRLPKEQLTHIGQTVTLALSFLGHAYSMLAGLCKFFADKLRTSPTAFPATNVDALETRFADGLRILGGHYRKNPGCLVIAALCIERSIFLWTQGGVDLPTLITYSYIFLASTLVPVLLTPQLYMQVGAKRKGEQPAASVAAAPASRQQEH